MKKQYTHILWDWNGTLLNDMDHCVVSINKVLRKHNKPEIDMETYYREFDFPVRDYYERIGFNFQEIPFEVVGTEFIEEYYETWTECKMTQDAIDVLRAVKEAGISQSILSAAGTDKLEMCTEYFNIQDYFTELTGLDHHYAHGKVDIALEYMKRTGIPPEKILFVGDTTHDYEVAKTIGVDCVLYQNGHHPLDKLEACDAPTINSLNQVLDLINHYS